MPGGGKSTVGRQLARRLSVPFTDTDAEIEREVGESVGDVFARHGESHFRALESSTLDRLLEGSTGVIATGGGIVLRDINRENLRRKSICVYLRSSPEELFRRLRHDTKRPLLQVVDPLGKLRQLFTVRDPLYREVADFVIETGRPSVPTLVNMILMQLELAGVIDASGVPSPIDAPPH
jgi:shikimate kinase